MVNKVRTINFLPEVFRTYPNREFFDATLDVLTSQPNLRRVEGFIGEKYGYGVEPNDKYVVEPTKSRRDYQMDPGVVFLKTDTQTAQDFINYPGIINALKLENANVSNHDRLFNNEFYCWDPFVNYDKVVNYSQYYWIPNGPDAVPVTTNLVYLINQYTVTGDDNGYTFSEVDEINPEITLIRGGTYLFAVPANVPSFTPFWIQTVPGIDATALERNVPGVTNNGTSNGTVTFVAPDKSTFVDDYLYYQSGTDPLSVGRIKLIESNSENYVDVTKILGQTTYTSPNGVRFTNGLKITFVGPTFPESYENQTYYVEGVGTSIELINVKVMLAPESSSEAWYNPWGRIPWDISTWDVELNVPVRPDYITSDRKSRDLNAWARSNRWFNQDVLDITQQFLGYVSADERNTPTKAKRPILEFRQNLKFYNSGSFGLGAVSLFDTVTKDAFSNIEGKTPAEVGPIDGELLIDGFKIVFAADTNFEVRQNVYNVNLVPAGPGGVNVISLSPALDMPVENDTQVFTLYGTTQKGTTWRFNTDENIWLQCQRKTDVNQYIYFDVFNENGISLGNSDFYPGTTFKGCKLLSYQPGTGANDSVLGFPVTFGLPATIGDLVFDVNFNLDTFSYTAPNEDNVVQNVSVGYVHQYKDVVTYEKLTGWVPAIGESFQYQVFEFPVSEVDTLSFKLDVPARENSAYAAVLVYLNDNLLAKTDYSYIVNTTEGTTIVSVDSPAGTKVTILVISDYPSQTAYYQIPTNLQNNPFNENITSVAVGDMRNQYQSIFINAPGTVGNPLGYNNMHDLPNYNNYGTIIIQSSASMVLPGVFLRKQDANLFSALQYNSEQYLIYKTLLIDLAKNNDYSVYDSPAMILDDIVYTLGKTRTTTNSFFWSDMFFSGNPYIENTYTFNSPTPTAFFDLSDVWTPTMYTQANYNGVAVYLQREVDNRTLVYQLLKNIDYTVSDVSPLLTVNYDIQAGDKITVKEYNQTYGTYCPSTPSKLGLYPIFIPKVLTIKSGNNSYNFIQGHDGSLSRCYGTYDYSNGQFDDFRDSVLFEFEQRVWNNIKVKGPIPLTFDQVNPGEYRQTEYTQQEILEMYSINFLNWIGVNRMDYKTQVYSATNELTWNYNNSSNKFTNAAFLQGYWKGIYKWFYDTFEPATAPWEMLGFVNKPTWWEGKYGAAPYTSGNLYMWTDIANGYVYNDGDPYINPLKVRPGLLDALPVDSAGNQLNPMQVMVGLYDNLTFNRDWVVGDQSPVETSYLESSTWPFDAMRLLALTKPAKFFNLFADLDLYRFNTEFNQYLYNDRYHLNAKNVIVYGNGTAKHSYINWIVDYINQRGANGTDVVTNYLKNLDVRLCYNLAGFSGKNYLKFFVEKATPNSNNTSLLIPDENYAVLLYDNPPDITINFSSVIVQKGKDSYVVYGNSKNKQYFTVLPPKLGYFETVSVGTVSVQVSKEFYADRKAIVPYGTKFYSLQAVSEFLLGYGRFLDQQGVKSETIKDGFVIDWNRMVGEYLLWAQQSWEVGSSISLNPNATNFNIEKEGLVVQPLNFQKSNFILNQNLLPMQNQNISIERENTAFRVKVLSPGDAIAYSNINLHQVEHAVVFDNTTSFNDEIYNLITGSRQNRLLLQGYKTDEWNGFIDANGFILNEDNIKEWEPNKKYPKNIIVTHKGRYYTAKRLIEPEMNFSEEDWLETEYDKIKTGILPNPSTVAYEALYYYDSDRANLENDVDLLAFSLIGFRPRDYLADADLSDITQINIYKNILRGKGTNQLANTFKNAKFDQGTIDYDLHENWEIKNGVFGSVLNNNFIEAKLIQSELTGNPTVIGFNLTGAAIEGVQQVVKMSDIINYERPPVSPNFLPTAQASVPTISSIPSAGFVNLNDVKFAQYAFENLNDDPNNINKLFVNDYVWLANHNSSWDIFTIISVPSQIVKIQNNLNGTISLTFNGIHGLVKNDLIGILNFDTNVNGFYKVKNVVNLYTITIAINLGDNFTQKTGNGYAFKFVSLKFNQPSDAASLYLPYQQWSQRKIWAEEDSDGTWAVYQAYPSFSGTDLTLRTGNFGISVAYSNAIGKMVVDGQGRLFRIKNDQTIVQYNGGNGSGTEVKIVGNYVYCSDPATKRILIYTYSSESDALTLTKVVNLSNFLVEFTGAFAVSQDRMYLYSADAVNQKITLHFLNAADNYQIINFVEDPAVPANSGWGKKIATDTKGYKLIVSAPDETIDSKTRAGAVYVYNKRVQRFYANGLTTTFLLNDFAPTNQAQLYLDDVLLTTDYTLSGKLLTFDVAPQVGTIITASTGYVEFAQKFTSTNIMQNALFGNSIDTNRYGADIVVGSPYEIDYAENTPGIEGAVYRFTNSGQRYGLITGTVTGSASGQILVDGYIVDFNGDIASIVDAINVQTPTNIIASYTGNNLVITVKDNTPEVKYSILDITGPVASLQALGITAYTQTQKIQSFNKASVSAFGFCVKMNEQDNLLISAPTETKHQPTIFDFTDNCNQDDTIFDNGATTWVDRFLDEGNVYDYSYLPAYQEDINNPGLYAFGQFINSDGLTNGPQPKFGYTLAYSDNVIVVATPNWSSTQGGVATYKLDYSKQSDCITINVNSWFIDKKPIATVDINSLQNISLYNTYNNSTLDYLDYIDPIQGKLLGVVATNLNYLSSTDPAVYVDNNVAWFEDHVGDTWLDLRTIRLLDYHQPDITYNAKHWGKAFPGSTANVYTWIESLVKPLSYRGPGYPLSFDNFTSTTSLDRATNNLITKYYFWVKNYNEIPPGKQLSPNILSQYILNPLNSGVSYLAPLTTNIVSLSNCGDSILSAGTALHLGYKIPDTLDEKHSNWLLIREDEEQDFLTGLPNIVGNEPSALYQKFLESFAGIDKNLNDIPDPRLPDFVKYGTSFRPKQSMFINRFTALENYIQYANEILLQYPIVEMRSLAFLKKFNECYDVRKYWNYVNYWAPGYTDETKAVIEVSTYNQLQTILPNELIVSTSGVNIFLENGLIAKVHMNTLGRAEYYVYVEDIQTWERIGVENGTIQISPALYGPYGWSSNLWGDCWDKTLSDEIYWVVRWLNEQCYIDNLKIERNRSLILMFKYIQSESLMQNNYLPWLNKTSLIDVKHKIRDLLPYKKFQRDNQSFLEGYLNEIKPFHVKIKDFIFTYNGLDVWPGNVTDFDLPAKYNSTTGKFATPQLVYKETYEYDQYQPDSLVWQQREYTEWFNNYGLSITNDEIGQYPITSLLFPISASAITAKIRSAYGLPTAGTVIINDEEINYNYVDYATNTLVGLSRGANETLPQAHAAGTVVYSKLPAVVVLDRGRNYVEPPRVIAYIDTSIYPEPREAAVLQPIMGGDKLIGVKVINPGSGYAVKPDIIIESSETVSVPSTSIDIINNVINITGHTFVDGDSVTYTVGDGDTAPEGVEVNTYYYVRVIDVNNIALYKNFRDASIYNLKTQADDTNRVKFIDQGTGTQNLNLTAKAICFTSGMPIREFTVSLKFNRVSYTTKITDWEAGTAYIIGDLVLYSGNVYRCVTTNVDSTFTLSNWRRVYADDPELTAADIVYGFYNPNPNMPGKDFAQLMTGMTYPNSIISGEAFNPGWDGTFWAQYGFDGPVDDPLVDVNYTSPLFQPDPSEPDPDYQMQGGQFADGYGPEELVPGVVTDTLNFTVYSSYPVAYYDYPPNPIINFRISMLNPQYSAITLGSTTVTAPVTMSALMLGDTIYLNNVSAILKTQTSTFGYVRIKNEIIYYSSIDLANNSISGLKRGLFSTPVNDYIASDSVAIGLDIIELGQVYNINPYTQATLISTLVTSDDPYNDIIYVDDVSKLLGDNLATSYIYVNGEYIQFNIVDVLSNSVTGLVRGAMGSITNAVIPAGTTVQSVLQRDKLPFEYYNQWWYNNTNWDMVRWDRFAWDLDSILPDWLYESTHPAAVFLKRQAP